MEPAARAACRAARATRGTALVSVTRARPAPGGGGCARPRGSAGRDSPISGGVALEKRSPLASDVCESEGDLNKDLINKPYHMGQLTADDTAAQDSCCRASCAHGVGAVAPPAIRLQAPRGARSPTSPRRASCLASTRACTAPGRGRTSGLGRSSGAAGARDDELPLREAEALDLARLDGNPHLLLRALRAHARLFLR